MSSYSVSEIFKSFEGEAQYTGHPTLYVRFARCNFTCAGFNGGVADKSGYAKVDFNPKDYSRLQDLPMITKGCDSQYAVNPEFSHLWAKMNEDELANAIVKLLPNGQWTHGNTKLPMILSLTGGEPTLIQKTLPSLLNHPLLEECKHILIETNCSVPIRDDFLQAMNGWMRPDRKITWSNSPKLSGSGEPWDKAIKPLVAMRQMLISGNVEQYFKFVVGPHQHEFDEVNKAIEEYYSHGVPTDTKIYMMPQACTESQQHEISQQVADMCISQGFIFCYRVQNAVYANAIGK